MNTFGRLFRLSIFGESHQNGVGVILDGVPAGLNLTKEDFKVDLDRRKPGKLGTTKRIEDDDVKIESGLYNDKTTGAPILLLFENSNVRNKDYDSFRAMPRPGHADFAAGQKYHGFNDIRGGGHTSGRITLGLTAAGVVAKKIIPNVTFETKIINLGGCEDEAKFDDIIKKTAMEGDSVGGIIELRAKNVEVGLGEPFFDSFESVLSHLLFSIGGVKGVEFGTGFKGASLRGSQFNDAYINQEGQTKTNHSGGINGGITNGNEIVVKVFIKPTPSIFKEQETYNFKENKIDKLKIEGRHDAAIILRAQVVCEATLAITLADFSLINKAYR